MSAGRGRGTLWAPGAGARWLAPAVAVLLIAAPAPAMTEEDLRELSLEQLLDFQITSVSKKPESLADAAASVYVLTGEDLRRSGATSLAEALRLVPGLMVARSDAQTWAISARGFNSTTANKLEVLLDGRSLYTPLFSGVFWDAQDTVLADVDRIEVIRGPGATLWGANAVNGVINITTKDARDTQGSLVVLGGGNEERGFAAVRRGVQLDSGAHLRVYGKTFNRDDSAFTGGGDGFDDWYQARAGFRYDRDRSAGDFSLQGEVYGGRAETVDPTGSPPGGDDRTEVAGGHVLGRWRRPLAGGGENQLQAYYDRTRRDIPGVFAEDRDIFNLDFQQRRPVGARHEMVWGVSYRLSADDVDDTNAINWEPSSRNLQLFGAFIQDEISLAGGRVDVTVGTKLEHNDYTGFEIQPSARLLWRLSPRQGLWAAASRAVRTPNRLDSDIRLEGTLSEIPPLSFAFLGGDIDAEVLLAFEAGYRARAASNVSMDLAVYRNRYDKLLSIEGPGAPFFERGQVFVPFVFGNGLSGDSHGAELSVLWQPVSRWRLHAAWTWFELDLEAEAGSTGSTDAEGNDPRHQLSVRWTLDLNAAWSFDGALRWIDELPNLGVDDYAELDLRLAFKPNDRLTLSLVGQNLLDDRHLEWGPDATAVERGVYGEMRWAW